MTEDITKPSLEIQVSDQIGELVGALAAAQNTFESVEKNKKGQPFSGKPYLYADWSEILKMALPKLNAQGLVLVQNTYPCVEDGNLYVQSALYHKSGQFMRSYFPVCSLRNTKQQDLGSSLTYAKRYGGSALLGISTEEDTDAQGSEVKTDNGKKVYAKQPKAPEHNPETGEVIVDSKEIARAISSEIVKEGFNEELGRKLGIEIDSKSERGVINKVQKEILDKMLHARKMIFETRTFEMLERSREAVDAVPADFRGKLVEFLKEKEAEVSEIESEKLAAIN